MYQFLRSDVFERWLKGLKDTRAKARILARIRSAEHGNFGDCRPIGDGVSEMRIHYAQVIASTTHDEEKSSTCCSSEGTKDRKSAISKLRLRWPQTLERINHDPF
jgi:putative component of toxin-antitoxin plasmid stabilization module